MAETPPKPAKNRGQTVSRAPDGRFLPGHPSGPGRPQGSRNRTTVLLDQLLDGEAEAVLRATIESAIGGDASAQRALLDRAMPARKGARVRLDLPPVEDAAGVLKGLAAVVAAMARGELTPDEAATMAGVISAPKAILEVQEMDRRIAELERVVAQKGGDEQ